MLYNMFVDIAPWSWSHENGIEKVKFSWQKSFFRRINLADSCDNIYHYHEKIKQLENEMEQKKRCNINAYKCKKYSMSLIICSILFWTSETYTNF